MCTNLAEVRFHAGGQLARAQVGDCWRYPWATAGDHSFSARSGTDVTRRLDENYRVPLLATKGYCPAVAHPQGPCSSLLAPYYRAAARLLRNLPATRVIEEGGEVVVPRGHNKQQLRCYLSAWLDEDLNHLPALLLGPGVSDLPDTKDWLARVRCCHHGIQLRCPLNWESQRWPIRYMCGCFGLVVEVLRSRKRKDGQPFRRYDSWIHYSTFNLICPLVDRHAAWRLWREWPRRKEVETFHGGEHLSVSCHDL